MNIDLDPYQIELYIDLMVRRYGTQVTFYDVVDTAENYFGHEVTRVQAEFLHDEIQDQAVDLGWYDCE